MGDEVIKVAFCVAYDWPLLAHSVPRVYEHADVIWISVDRERFSWSGKPFEFDEISFRRVLRSLDPAQKIYIYEENFHLTSLTPAQNEVRQRRMTSEKMGDGGWHIQLDCDEYFLEFGHFTSYLRSLPAKGYKFNVCCQLITVFKKVKDGYLYVYPDRQGEFEFLQVASRTPAYIHGRRNEYFNILTSFLIVHQSWARSENEIFKKLSNWGHVNDFDVMRYFQFWKGVTEDNYSGIRSFHPILPKTWPGLRLKKASKIEDLLNESEWSSFPTLGPATKLLKNSLSVSRVLKVLRSLYKKLNSGK